MRTGIRLLVTIFSFAIAAAPAAGEDGPTILDDGSSPKPGGLTRNPSGLSDAELDARLRFLEERLDDGKVYARNWQWGWTAGYSLGIVIGTAEAITCCSTRKSGRDHSVSGNTRHKGRTKHIVTAAKGVIGTSRMLLNRHPGRHGADAMRAIEGDSREARLARLARGAEVLQAVAKQAKRRTDWRSHAGNVGLNLAGGAFIFGFGRKSDAWESMGLGVGVGTLQILTAPKRGIQDLEDYETRFGMKTASRFHWSVVPTAGGAALQVTF
ncbi:MAG: hypothetical protein JRF15_06810 [Deltaproteobacteria bacterium]|nr:hypothetical protein [Deltaproteobacteria bacterium]